MFHGANGVPLISMEHNFLTQSGHQNAVIKTFLGVSSNLVTRYQTGNKGQQLATQAGWLVPPREVGGSKTLRVL